MGLAEGVATGASRTISTILDRRQEEASAARKYMQQRNIQKAEQYEADTKEMQALMGGFAELTGGDLDKAAQLIKGAGNIELAKERLSMLNAEVINNKNFDINKTFEFAKTETRSNDPYVIGDYIESLIKRPTLAKLPESTKVGLGLADKFLPKAEKIALSGPSGRIIDIGTARMIPGSTSAGIKFEQELEATDLAIQKARAQIAKIESEIGKENALTNAGFRSNMSLIDSNNSQGLPTKIVDGVEVIDYKTAEEKNIDLGSAHTEIVRQSTKLAVDATGTLSDSSNLATLVAKASAKINIGLPNERYIVNIEETPTDEPEVGKVYKVRNPDGLVLPHLYIGKGIAPIPLY